MSSAAKETEILTSIPENATARPQPVALEVAVTVNGARTVAASDKREPFSETTKTVLGVRNGAVIRLSSSVAPGQLLFLTNEKTKKEVVCQVVKSKNYRSLSGYVELEFTESVVGFWGMRFPSDRLGVAPETGAPAIPQPVVLTAPVSASREFALNSAPVNPVPLASTLFDSPRASEEQASILEPPKSPGAPAIINATDLPAA